jgi:hypothetical protein
MVVLNLLFVILGIGCFVLYAPIWVTAILALIISYPVLCWAIDRWLDI